MSKDRPYVLSIAGFDPSGGAGVLADIKTFEQHKVMGMGIVSGLTFQNENEFHGVQWIEFDTIKKQLVPLLRNYKFKFVKIGMIESLEVLEQTISELKTKNNELKIIWDPILKASAGFEIHKPFEQEKLISILKQIYLITPNLDEVKTLTNTHDTTAAAKSLAKYCNVFLKGGHAPASKKKAKISQGRDYLFTTEGKVFPYRPKKLSSYSKHGSGCILSSSIIANLSNAVSLQRACLKGKDYITKILVSNKTLLAYHKQ